MQIFPVNYNKASLEKKIHVTQVIIFLYLLLNTFK